MKISVLNTCLTVFLFVLVCNNAFSQPIIDSIPYVQTEETQGSFPLVSSGVSIPIYVSLSDFSGVIRATKDLQSDIKKVTSIEPQIISKLSKENEIIIVGTVGESPIINQLVVEKKLDITSVSGKWETFIITTVEKPFPGVKRALVIVGSDKRGTIYGIYNLSENIGVSPWYWWADVPVIHKKNLFVTQGIHSIGEPKVKYRGIFINDEAPALSGWTYEKNGGFNHKLYGKVFELILRLKGNYLWPAMWGSAFNLDDTLNSKLADEYGVVMGTSHHEPMLRAQQEWKRFGKGAWNYQTNDTTLRRFWKQGIINMGNHESIITVGMRGDGDMAMTEGSNVALLEKIVKDQREIIKDVTGKNPSEVPQLWALYKEVQDYYDKGMRVPDDITLLLCDDNWGNIRKLPNPEEKIRKGGYGIYYHFDYVGGPRNYKWLNTNHVPKIWEQMHKAWQFGANNIWIVNVGDIKPMEYPISFFLDYAWNPERFPLEKLDGYAKVWAEKQFGPKYASDIAYILSKYGKFNSRRKPELLSPETYSLTNYKEAETVTNEYNNLLFKADSIYKLLPNEYKDAYYQLVLHPVQACSNLNQLYYMVAKNRMYAKQGRVLTNQMADSAKRLFSRDAEIAKFYNKSLAGGKWNHMMDQTHIGYTYWQQPDSNKMPEVKYISISANSDFGIYTEESNNFWPNDSSNLSLPEFNKFQQQSYYFEVFNKGTLPIEYSIKSSDSWLHIFSTSGKIVGEKRFWVTIDWQKAPKGIQNSKIFIYVQNSKEITINTSINNPELPKIADINGFVANNGYVSIEAMHYTKTIEQQPYKWQIIPDIGRTQSGITLFPVTAKNITPELNNTHLEYQFQMTDTGKVKVEAYFSPTLSFKGSDGMKYGISIDDEPIQIINIHSDNSMQAWEKWVANSINVEVSNHKITSSGVHTLKFWLVDPCLILQKLVINKGGSKPSYLGPPESFYHVSK